MVKTNEPWVKYYSYIKQRCNNKNANTYKNYGGRGIKALISKEELGTLWKDCRADMMDKPSIDRIDNDGDYTLTNCRFVELVDNARRRRNINPNCPKGHPYSGDNLYLNLSYGHKKRVCRICASKARKRWRLRNESN